MTYKEVATKAGTLHAARAVGAIMRTNYDDTIPCHRVVRTDGDSAITIAAAHCASRKF